MVDICPADPQNSYFKQDVSNIILNFKRKIQKKCLFGTREFKN